MKILYFGKICDDELFQKKQEKKEPFFIAQYMYEKALCDSLKKDKNIDLSITSIYQTKYFPNDKLIFKRRIDTESEHFNYVSFINLPLLREITYFLSSVLIIFEWLINNRKVRDKYIYSSCHFAPVSLGIVLMGKIFNIKKIVTFTDLPLFTYSDDKIKRMKVYKRILMKPYLMLIDYLQKQYDGYILFSEAMNDKVNPLNKKVCIVEGMFNSAGINLNHNIKKKNTVVHAGTLNKEVGIDKILDVFDMLKNENFRLLLIGQGDMVEEIKKREKNNKNIKYIGFVEKNKLFNYLQESKLLINLRNPDDIYTMYSFPSKMFEYMASGTPVLTTVLKGIPLEYYDYVYSVDSYNTNEISNKIVEIMGEDDKELSKVGNKAKEFILNKKNSTNQTSKIINFLNSI